MSGLERPDNLYDRPKDGKALPKKFNLDGTRIEANGTAPGAVVEPARRNWGWQDLGALKDTPAAKNLVPGLLIEGNLTLLYASVKTGKSRLLMGLLAALAPGGPKFCGMALKDTRTLLFSEEPPTVLGERVRDFGVPTGQHIVNTASALAMPPQEFADEVEAVHRKESDQHGNFGLIAVDTMGSFVSNRDWNDYSQTTAAMSPLRDLARRLPRVAILLLHHMNKQGGADWAGALGSTALAGNVDQIIRMTKKNAQHQITVGGRNKPDPFPFDEPSTISIASTGIEFVGTATDEAGELLAEHLGDVPVTIKDLTDSMGQDGPSRDAVTKAMKGRIEAGTAVLVQPSRGSKPALYKKTA